MLMVSFRPIGDEQLLEVVLADADVAAFADTERAEFA
jgi:hypothetical protein